MNLREQAEVLYKAQVRLHEYREALYSTRASLALTWVGVGAFLVAPRFGLVGLAVVVAAAFGVEELGGMVGSWLTRREERRLGIKAPTPPPAHRPDAAPF